MENTENNEDKNITESGEEKADGQAEEKKVKHSRLSNYEKHLVPCPHCGKDILDHFTECPHCGGAVDPLGYCGDEKKLARAKRISTIVGVILSIGLVVAMIAISYVKNKDKTEVVVPDMQDTAICREIDF